MEFISEIHAAVVGNRVWTAACYLVEKSVQYYPQVLLGTKIPVLRLRRTVQWLRSLEGCVSKAVSLDH